MTRKKKEQKETIIVEDLPQAEQLEVEAIGASVSETLRRYFGCVFRVEHFTIALDVTGVYVFAEEGSDEEIVQWATELTETLGLKQNQISICVVGRKSELNYTSKKMLGKFVNNALNSRKPILKNQDIVEIQEVYGISTEHSQVYRDYRNTKLFKSLVKVYSEHAYDVDEVVICNVCRIKPRTIAWAVKLGIPRACAPDVVECLQMGHDSTPEETFQRVDYATGESTQVQEVAKHVGRATWIQMAFIVLYWTFCMYKGWFGCVVTGVFASLFNAEYCKSQTVWRVLDASMIIAGLAMVVVQVLK